MVALLRAIAREACRGAEPDGHAVALCQDHGAPARALGHGDGGLTATGLLRICPEVVPERARVIGNDGFEQEARPAGNAEPVSYTHLRAHETPEHLVCRLLL